MRPIDADEFEKRIKPYDTNDPMDRAMYSFAHNMMMCTSTVDAEPVRHGRWIEVDVGDCCYRCSECGFIRDAYLLDIGNYCPQCGAKMNEEEKKNGIN